MKTMLQCNNCGSMNINEIKDFNLVDYYRDLIADGELDISILEDGDSPWCYLAQLVGTTEIDDPEHIPYALEALCKCVYTPVLQLSVTSQEDHYKVWLDCIKGIPGHTIFEYYRGGYTVGYTVYLCTFPVNPNI